MKKIAVGIMVAAAFALISYGSFAGSEKSCKQSSDKPCATQQMQGKCGMQAAACCDKCAKGECCKSDGKPCCDKCCCGKGCAMKDGKCPGDCSCKNCACRSCCKTGQATDTTKQDFALDPVCGMDVTMKDAGHTHEYKGKTYYFCSETCKERFSKDPDKFLAE